MLFQQRIIRDAGGTLTDYSRELSDLYADTVVLPLASTDYLYVGSDLPFNHRFFYVDAVNIVGASFTAEIWDGKDWVAAVDVVDRTASGGKPLARSGVLQWSTERNATWSRENTTEDIPALATLKIYDLYWARLRPSVTLTLTTSLKYVGHCFASDNDLGGRYPDLIKTEMLDAFKTDKTDWTDQHVLAAEAIIVDLRSRGTIWSPSQLLHWEQFTQAAVHKCAEIVYAAFGAAYADHEKRARDRYEAALTMGPVVVDRDADGRIDVAERLPYRAGSLRRQ